MRCCLRLLALVSAASITLAFASCSDDEEGGSLLNAPDAAFPDGSTLPRDGSFAFDAGAANDSGGTLVDTGVPDAGRDTGSDAATDSGTAAVLASCKAILAANRAAPTGTYSIDPDGTGPLPALPAYCDMTFAGGGWTLLHRQDHRLLAAPGDAGSDASVEAGFYLRPPAPDTVGAFNDAFAQALAASATEVHIRSPFVPGNVDGGGDAGWITSKVLEDGGVTLPVTNLRKLAMLNVGSDGGFLDDWTGPHANSDRLRHENAGGCSPVNSGRYPDIYWACNNGTGLHITTGNSRWDYDIGVQEAIETYVR